MQKFFPTKTLEILKSLNGLSYEDCCSIISDVSFILKDLHNKREFDFTNEELSKFIKKEQYNSEVRES